MSAALEALLRMKSHGKAACTALLLMHDCARALAERSGGKRAEKLARYVDAVFKDAGGVMLDIDELIAEEEKSQ